MSTLTTTPPPPPPPPHMASCFLRSTLSKANLVRDFALIKGIAVHGSFRQVQQRLLSALGHAWHWDKHVQHDGRSICERATLQTVPATTTSTLSSSSSSLLATTLLLPAAKRRKQTLKNGNFDVLPPRTQLSSVGLVPDSNESNAYVACLRELQREHQLYSGLRIKNLVQDMRKHNVAPTVNVILQSKSTSSRLQNKTTTTTQFSPSSEVSITAANNNTTMTLNKNGGGGGIINTTTVVHGGGDDTNNTLLSEAQVLANRKRLAVEIKNDTVFARGMSLHTLMARLAENDDDKDLVIEALAKRTDQAIAYAKELRAFLYARYGKFDPLKKKHNKQVDRNLVRLKNILIGIGGTWRSYARRKRHFINAIVDIEMHRQRYMEQRAIPPLPSTMRWLLHPDKEGKPPLSREALNVLYHYNEKSKRRGGNGGGGNRGG